MKFITLAVPSLLSALVSAQIIGPIITRSGTRPTTTSTISFPTTFPGNPGQPQPQPTTTTTQAQPQPQPQPSQQPPPPPPPPPPPLGERPPPGFNITSLGYNGSGCPPGSAYYVLSTDRTKATITFSEYGAEAGPGVPSSSNRKNCQATLGVRVPGGYSFAVVSVDYRGFYQLDTNVVATQNAVYYFQGYIQQSTARSELRGPVAGEFYTYRDVFEVSTTIYSPCGQDTVLNINTDLRVNNQANRTGTGYITNDSIDASLEQTYYFQWQRCT